MSLRLGDINTAGAEGRFSHYCCYSWAAFIGLHWDAIAALLSALVMTSYKYTSLRTKVL